MLKIKYAKAPSIAIFRGSFRPYFAEGMPYLSQRVFLLLTVYVVQKEKDQQVVSFKLNYSVFKKEFRFHGFFMSKINTIILKS